MSSAAGPSSPPKLTGNTPGLLDPSQRDRLLKFPTSSLSFAFFDPRTASAAQDASKLSLNERLYNQKRVVVEAHPTGEQTFRFVPKAQLDEGVIDEGQWPRVVDICGALYLCCQDQWDIYKLDPNYDCRVRPLPALSTITHATPKPKESPRADGKRAFLPDPSIPPLHPRKKTRNLSSEIPFTINLDDDEESEMEEVEEMIVDGDTPPPRPRSRSRSAGVGASDRARKLREKILENKKNRKERREKIARRAEKLSNTPSFEFGSGDLHGQSTAYFENQAKRKATSLADPSLRAPDPHYASTPEGENARNSIYYERTTQSKRTRTGFPKAGKREFGAKRQQRDRKRQERREEKVSGRRQQWYEKFMQELLAEVPDLGGPFNGNGNGIHDDAQLSDSEESSSSRSDTPDTEFDEEAAREAAIAESRRKLAELEADRPLWDAEAKKRALREKAEEEARRLQAEERRWAEARKAEEARQAEARRKAQEAREREEAERRQREEASRRQREKQQRQQRWSYGPWTTHRALERYRTLSEAFDVTKFSAEEPLSFEAIPWPVLISPVSLSVEDIDWATVEKFFEVVRPHMRTQDYKSFIEKSHRRFHPDRWRSRGLLKTVIDEAERGCLEVAANTVAQALTPLWREITGR